MDRDEYVRRERDYDERKRRQHLEDYEREKEEQSDDEKLSLKERVQAFKKRREYRQFQKDEDKKLKKQESRDRVERNVYGHVLDTEERDVFENYHEQRKQRTRQRIERLRRNAEHSGGVAKRIADKMERMELAFEDLHDEQVNDPLLRMYGFKKRNVDPVAELYGVGQRQSGPDPLVEMFAPSAQVQQFPKHKQGKDPLMEFYSMGKTDRKNYVLDDDIREMQGGFGLGIRKRYKIR